MSSPDPVRRSRWAEAWPDALAFVSGLGLAWSFQWATADLVWSLWLSSLVVGYCLIVWSIFGPALHLMWRARREDLAAIPPGRAAAGGVALLLGGLFLLAFFTVHFGMFHFVHSVFLNSFFPVRLDAGKPTMPDVGLYAEIVRRYWWFLPAAFLAERKAFSLKPAEATEAPDIAVTVAAIAARKARNAKKGGFGGMMAPYKNVVRLHLLIFFFAGAHFAKLDSFLVYAVVYAVYFFPWRLVGQEKS